MGFALHAEMIYSYIFPHGLQGARALLCFTGVSSCPLELLDRIIVTTPSYGMAVEIGSHAGES